MAVGKLAGELTGIGANFGIIDFYSYIGALLTGAVMVPLMLPWIPGRSFAWKGWLLGFVWILAFNLINGWPISPDYSMLKSFAYFLTLPSISAFLAMNFTGSSTFTSLSGVRKEMAIAVPLILISFSIGVILWLLASFSI